MQKMAINDDECWSRVKGRLRSNVGEDVYSSWFARMDLESVSDGAAHMSVPTRFLKSWIQSHYADRVLSCWQADAQGGALQGQQSSRRGPAQRPWQWPAAQRPARWRQRGDGRHSRCARPL